MIRRLSIGLFGAMLLLMPALAAATPPPAPAAGGGSPEPPAIWLLVAGALPLLGLYLWARRRELTAPESTPIE